MNENISNSNPGGKLTSSPVEKKNVSGALVGNACILIATIFWGMNVAVTKALIPEWMTADGITAVRLIGGAALMWIVSLFVKDKPIEHHDWIKLFLGGAIVVIASSGSGSSSGSDKLLGDLLAVASTICYAFYLVILEGPTKKYRPSNMLRWVFLFAAIPAVCLIPGMDKMPILATPDARPWVEIGFILLCPTFFAYFLVQPAVKRIGSELVSIYQYLLPVFATLTAVLMGIDKLHWVQVAAMVVIVAGMIHTNLAKSHETKPTSTAGNGK